MPDTPQTRNAILDASRAARDKLTAYDHALQDEISDLDDIAFKRELTTNERAKRDKLRAAQANCHHAMVELSFATAAALDNTPEVQRMRNEMATIRSSIAADQPRSRPSWGRSWPRNPRARERCERSLEEGQ